MFCTKCGKEIPEGGNFCKECGAPIAAAENAAQPAAVSGTQAVPAASKPINKKVLAVVGITIAIVAVIIGLVLLLSNAKPTPAEYFDYEIYSEGVVIKRYNGNFDKVVIPETIEGESVVRIDREAFKECKITSVTIPKSVVEIGESAFRSCEKLKNVSLSEGLNKIGAQAFNQCPLTSLNIPDSVTEIGVGALKYTKLSRIKLPTGLTAIQADTFSGCSSLKEVIIPDGVTSIGFYAFVDCNSLEQITIPDSVIDIQAKAFSSNELKITYKGKTRSYSEWRSEFN